MLNEDFRIYADFNSIKVQLKLLIYPKVVDSAIFQFHKGTIKTFLELLECTFEFISIP